MPAYLQNLPLLQNNPLAPKVHRLSFHSPLIARVTEPGQFVMLRPLRFSEPLLPRPFSIHRLRGNRLEVLIKVVGRGTDLLSSLRKGDPVELRGPLGRGFRFRPDQNLVLVAGGIGVAPLLFVAETWGRWSKPSKKSLTVFLGARSEKELLCLSDFQRTGGRVLVTTEDGSLGEKGRVTELLRKKLNPSAADQVLLVCGPPPMLKAVRDWAVSLGLPCQLSLETHMACGLGACLGCVTACRRGSRLSYVNVCQEGPVFDAAEVLGNE